MTEGIALLTYTCYDESSYANVLRHTADQPLAILVKQESEMREDFLSPKLQRNTARQVVYDGGTINLSLKILECRDDHIKASRMWWKCALKKRVHVV